MNTLQELYQGLVTDPRKNSSTDIFEHLPTLKELAASVDTVTEMGVRWGASTTALALGKPKLMISYDIAKTPSAERVIGLVQKDGLNHSFIIADTLKITIAETDMLFIDTLHTYNQLSEELKLHADKVKKYIVLHDTVSFGRTDESIYGHASDVVKNMSVAKTGLMTAVEDFLEFNSEWQIKRHYENNNGLMVLERIS